VVGVAQADLRPDVVRQFVLVYGFYRCGGAHGHKNGRFDGAVIGGEQAGAGAGMLVTVLKRKCHSVNRMDGV